MADLAVCRILCAAGYNRDVSVYQQSTEEEI